MENPWNIQSIYDLQFFNCPSCMFKNHSKQKLVNHAYEIHPESIEYLMNLDDESISDIEFPWNNSKIDMISQFKTEEPDIEDLEEIKEEDLDKYSNTNAVDIKSEADYFVETSECNFTENSCEIKNEKSDHFGDESNCVESVEDPLSITKVDSKNRKSRVKTAKGVKDLHCRDTEDPEKSSNKCNLCGKNCTTKGNLKTHLKLVHDRIKDHNCNFCGNCFSTAQNLKSHVKAVHEHTGRT